MAAHYVTLRWKLFQIRGSPARRKHIHQALTNSVKS